jgi:hypothetical protein
VGVQLRTNKWYLAAGSLAAAADALNTYRYVLKWVQQQAAEGTRLCDEAQAETQIVMPMTR